MYNSSLEKTGELQALQFAFFSNQESQPEQMQKPFLEAVAKSLSQLAFQETSAEIKKATSEPPLLLNLKKLLQLNPLFLSNLREQLTTCKNENEKLNCCLAEIAKICFSVSESHSNKEMVDHRLSQNPEYQKKLDERFLCIEEILKRAASAKLLIDPRQREQKNSNSASNDFFSFQSIETVHKEASAQFDRLRVWLEVRIFPGSQFHDLIDQIADFAQLLMTSGLIYRWYYEKASDKEPHLRLFFQGNPEVLHHEVSTRLSQWIHIHLMKGRISRFTTHDYEMKMGEFGGEGLFEVAEMLFYEDSKYCCKVLSLFEQKTYGLSIECLAALGIIAILKNSQLGLPSLLKFLGRNSIHLFKGTAEFEQTANLAAMLWNNLALPYPFSEIEQFCKNSKTLVERFCNRPECLDRFLHLHCNRLMGTQPGGEKAARSIALYALEKYLSA